MLFFIIRIVDAPFYADARKRYNLCLAEVINQIKFIKKNKNFHGKPFF